MGRKRNSRYTVCGQAQPHHARPNSAVSRKIPMIELNRNSMNSSVSVGRNVHPMRLNSRLGKLMRNAGFPPMRMCGIAKKSSIRAYATT
jgi:hypothetical protein